MTDNGAVDISHWDSILNLKLHISFHKAYFLALFFLGKIDIDDVLFLEEVLWQRNVSNISYDYSERIIV